MDIQEIKSLLENRRTKFVADPHIYEIPIPRNTNGKKYVWIIRDLDQLFAYGNLGTVTAWIPEKPITVKFNRYSNFCRSGYFQACHKCEFYQHMALSRIEVFGNHRVRLQSNWVSTVGFKVEQKVDYLFSTTGTVRVLNNILEPSNFFQKMTLDLGPTPTIFKNFLVIMVEFMKPDIMSVESLALEGPTNFGLTISKMFSNKELADVTIIVKSAESEEHEPEITEIMAHKAVLAVRSNVFKTMFEAEFKEKEFCRIEIVDFGTEIVEKVLKYLYLEIVELEDPDHVLDLIRFSDKYDIQELLETCTNYIAEHINEFQFITLLSMVHFYEDRVLILKKSIEDYFQMYEHTLFDSEDFKIAIRKYPQVFTELYLSRKRL